MDRGAWQATVHGVTKESDTTEHVCVCVYIYIYIYIISYIYKIKYFNQHFWLRDRDDKMHLDAFI